MSSTKTIGRTFDLAVKMSGRRQSSWPQRHFNSSTVVYRANASIAVHDPQESCLFINSKKSSQKQLLQQSLLVKLKPNLASTPSLECLRRKLLEESLTWIPTWTILSQRLSFIFQFLKIFNHAGFSKWRPKNPVKNNFSSLLLLRPRIVKISVVDGLLGCS